MSAKDVPNHINKNVKIQAIIRRFINLIPSSIFIDGIVNKKPNKVKHSFWLIKLL